MSHSLDKSHGVLVALSFSVGLAGAAVDHVLLLGGEAGQRRDDEDALPPLPGKINLFSK